MYDTHSMNLVGQGIAIGDNFYVVGYYTTSNDENENQLSSDLMVSGCSVYSMMITQYRNGEA